MSKSLCPFCQDFTEQKKLADVPGKIKNKSGIKLTIGLSLCLECDQIIDHEKIQLETPKNKGSI